MKIKVTFENIFSCGAFQYFYLDHSYGQNGRRGTTVPQGLV